MTSLAVNGKVRCKCIITVSTSGVEFIWFKIIQDSDYNQVHPNI